MSIKSLSSWVLNMYLLKLLDVLATQESVLYVLDKLVWVQKIQFHNYGSKYLCKSQSKVIN